MHIAACGDNASKNIKNVSAKIVRMCRDDAKRPETRKVHYMVEHSCVKPMHAMVLYRM